MLAHVIVRKARKAQGLSCVKMNATEDVNWLDTPSIVDAAVERLKAVKATGLDAGVDFHGRLHRPMAKQLAKALEPYRPLFIEEPVLVEHPEALKQLAGMTSVPIALGSSIQRRNDAEYLELSLTFSSPQAKDCTIDGILRGSWRMV